MTANVALTDSFDQWRVKTNEVIVMTQTDGMNNSIKVLDTTNSTSNTTGSIITAGGLGVLKSAVIGENLRVHGNVITDGDTTISGNLVFGNSDSDQVSFSADINSNFIPNADMTFDIGNTTFGWANTFTGHLSVEQGASAGKPAISVTSADADQIAIDVDAEQSSANVVDIDANSLTTGRVIDVTSGSITTGSLMMLNSTATNTSTRVLFKVTNDAAAATGTTAICAQSDAGRGVFIDSNLAAGGYSLEIDSEHETANTVKIDSATTSATILEMVSSGTLTGKIINIVSDTGTTGTGINMSMDGLTTGSAIVVDSDSSSTGTRNIVSIINNNIAATGAVPLHVKQDSTNIAGKFEAQTSVVIPVGTNAQRGTAVQGGLRYNTSTSSFEGYDGSAWAGLGGVMDADADTYISAEASADSDDLDFFTAGTKRMTINEAGAFLFPDTGGFKVGVDGTGYDVKFFGDTATNGYMLWDQSTDDLILGSSSKIGVGTATPSTELHVVGTITETSMREMKTNISNMENMLPSVLQMQGVEFDWKDEDKGKDNYGFIAEDVEKIFPNLVTYDAKGKPEGIQYTKMTAVLLEAIKEQQIQIDELKSKLN